MAEILDSIRKYVPTKRTTQEFDVPHGDEVTGIEHISVQVDHFHHILLGGDQLTVARIRGAQSVRNNSENGRSCLGGFIPVVEDWHTKMCYLKVGKIILCVANVYNDVIQSYNSMYVLYHYKNFIY